VPCDSTKEVETVTKRDSLGGFEEIVLLAVMRLGPDSYGVTIRHEIEERTGREVSLGAIYPTLDRLEDKRYVSSRKGEPTGERGGRARRHFKLEPRGMEALQRSRDLVEAMWEGFEPEGRVGS
jgi:PadR family transcriptional regulator PadR